MLMNCVRAVGDSELVPDYERQLPF